MKIFKEKALKSSNGITLIALVITIIVLLILAGISISMLTGDNSILQKATDAKNKSDETQIKEELQLVLLNSRIATNGEFNQEKAIQEIQNLNGANVEPNGNGLKGKYKGYNFTVDENGNLTMGSKVEIPTVDYEVGDFVNYTPNPTQTTYTFYSADSGCEEDQTVNAEGEVFDMCWRVLNINDDGTTDLISSRATREKISFGGAQGYNNGVYLLNEMCAKLYNNSTLGATARCLNIEDIQDHMQNKSIYQNFEEDRYDETWTNIIGKTAYGQIFDYTTNKHYPMQWKNDNAATGESLSRSKITGIATGEESSKLTATQTYWYAKDTTMKSAYSNNIYYELLNLNGFDAFWLASRCVRLNGSMCANFGLSCVFQGGVNDYYGYNCIYFSADFEEHSSLGVCPVITLPSNVIHKIDVPEFWNSGIV